MGTFEICSTGGIYLYTVGTTSGAITDAINNSHGAAADGARYATGPATYGREGGVYGASEMTGLTNVVLPPGSGQYLGSRSAASLAGTSISAPSPSPGPSVAHCRRHCR